MQLVLCVSLLEGALVKRDWPFQPGKLQLNADESCRLNPSDFVLHLIHWYIFQSLGTSAGSGLFARSSQITSRRRLRFEFSNSILYVHRTVSGQRGAQQRQWRALPKTSFLLVYSRCCAPRYNLCCGALLAYVESMGLILCRKRTEIESEHAHSRSLSTEGFYFTFSQ